MLQTSLRLIAALKSPGLGQAFPCLGAAVAAEVVCSSNSSRAVWQQRWFADSANGEDKPAAVSEGTAAAAAAAAGSSQSATEEGSEAGGSDSLAATDGESPEMAESEEEVLEGLIDYDSGAGTGGDILPKEFFSKRQLAWLGDNPDKHKHFLPALSRKEKGSFADEYAEEEFDVEKELYPTVPDNVPLYDLRTVVPEIYEPRSHLFERIKRLKEDGHPGMPMDQFIEEVLGFDQQPEQPPRPGARPIIRWQIRHVFAVGVNESHPANKKVKAWVYLRDLQEQYGLTDAALQHIATICGPRYSPHRGEVKLTSDRHPHREANRAHILQMLRDLVEEGRRKYPAPTTQQLSGEQEQQQQQQQRRQQKAGQQRNST